MSKFLKILIVSSLIMYTANAYATFDFISNLSAYSEKVEDIKQKYLSYANAIEQAKTDVTKGYEGVRKCTSGNVSGCMNAGQSIKELKGEYGDQIASIAVLPGSGLDTIQNKNAQEIIDNTKKAIYVANQGNSIENANQRAAANNIMLADDIATLFAKSTASRQRILKDGTDDKETYSTKDPFNDKHSDTQTMIQGKARQRLNSISRIARIIELRAYMIGIPATSELTMYVREAQDVQ